jgi:mercuric reductase
VIIERGTVGGTCVNVGCIPSKALLADGAGDAILASVYAIEARRTVADLAASAPFWPMRAGT